MLLVAGTQTANRKIWKKREQPQKISVVAVSWGKRLRGHVRRMAHRDAGHWLGLLAGGVELKAVLV